MSAQVAVGALTLQITCEAPGEVRVTVTLAPVTVCVVFAHETEIKPLPFATAIGDVGDNKVAAAPWAVLVFEASVTMK